jgi:hypothetical protein
VTSFEEPRRPQCGQLVGTVSSPTAGDQLAVERLECPQCGAKLVRDVEGHADRGWRLDNEPGL